MTYQFLKVQVELARRAIYDTFLGMDGKEDISNEEFDCMCAITSQLLIAILRNKGIECSPLIVESEHFIEGHCIVQVGDYYIDPTYTQYEKGKRLITKRIRDYRNHLTAPLIYKKGVKAERDLEMWPDDQVLTKPLAKMIVKVYPELEFIVEYGIQVA